MSEQGKPFEALGLSPELAAALAAGGVTEPSAVQRSAIPAMLGGKDGIVVSPTGTGKTLAYLMPILQRIDAGRRETQALIVAPTQELAMQIVREAEKYGGPSGIKTVGLIGGASLARQLDRMKAKPALVVGTPGRIREVASSRKLTLSSITTVVVDETDRVYSLGGRGDLEFLLKGCSRERQTVFVSATRSQPMREAEAKWLKDIWVAENQVAGNEQNDAPTAIPGTIDHWYITGERRDKIDLVRKLVRAPKATPALLFLNDTERIGELLGKLKYEGVAVDALYGDVSGRERGEALRRFRAGRTKLLIATDVAARGLDIPGLPTVIQFEPALDADHYVHRSGRTGRMGKSGISITLITPQERFIIDKLEKQLGISFSAKRLFEGRIVGLEEAVGLGRGPKGKRGMRSVDMLPPVKGKPSANGSRGTTAKASPSGTGSSATAAKAKLSGTDSPTTTTNPQMRSYGRKAATSDGKPRSAQSSASSSKAVPSKPGSSPKPAPTKASKTDRERDRKNKGAPRWLKEKRNAAADTPKPGLE